MDYQTEKIKAYYDINPEREWTRLDRYRLEFPIISKHLDNIINKENAKILDIGGGPGRYAFFLADKGHSVSLFDLSDGNIIFAKNKSIELGISLANYSVGDASDLTLYEDNYFERYVIANVKRELKRIIGSHTIPLPGGATLNVDEICNNIEDAENIEEKIRAMNGTGDIISQR